ncbi:uncharacterized protein adgrg2a isoform X2 [Vanacampus margaritifer]
MDRAACGCKPKSLSSVPAVGFFLGDTKAVLSGCRDHWSLQESASVPSLPQMSVCLDVRVLGPGAWVAFSYSSLHAPRPELGLEGNEGAVYGWLLGVRHRFPVSLSLARWHRVCLRRDVPGNSFSLELNGRLVAERTVIAEAVPPSGSLWLGCGPRQWPRGAEPGQVEVYMFRMWADLARRGPCEDGTVIGWNAGFWGVTSPRARQSDRNLQCAQTGSGSGPSFSPPPVSTSPVSRRQSESSVTVPPGGHKDKTPPSAANPSATTLPGVQSGSDGMTPLDITGSSIFTSSKVSSPPTSLAPPSDYSPANGISSSSQTLHGSSHKSNRTIDSLPPPANNALEINVTTVSAIAALIKDTPQSGRTTPSTTSDHNVATRYKGWTRLPNDNRSHTLLPSANDTLGYNVTTVSAIAALIKDTPQSGRITPSTTSDYNVATRNALAQLPNDTRASNVSNDFVLPPADNTLEYNVTTVSTITALIKDTSKYNRTTPSSTSVDDVITHKSQTNVPTVYDVAAADTSTPAGTSGLNVTTESSVTSTIKDTSLDNLTTLLDNVTTHKIFTNDVVPAADTTATALTDLRGTTVSLKVPRTQDNRTTPSPQSVHNVTTHYKASAPGADRTADNNQTTADKLVDLRDGTPPTKLTTAGDAQLDNVTGKHYDAAAYNHTKRHRTSTDVTSMSYKNKHPTSYRPTTSHNVTPPTDRTDGTTSNNRQDTPTESTRNDARVGSSTTVGASRFARTSTTMSATTTQTLQGNQTGPESSSPGFVPMTSTLSSDTKKNLEEQADRLLEKTQDGSRLNSSQVSKLLSELEKLVDAPTVSQALAKKAVGVVSNLMAGHPLALAASCNRMVRVVEDLGLKVLVSEQPAVLSSASLVVAVRKVDGSDFPEMSVNVFNTEHVQMSDGGGGGRSGKRDANMASVYLPSSITEALSAEQRQQVRRVQFAFYTKAVFFQDRTLSNLTLVSPVLASSVSNTSLSNLTHGIRFTIQNGRRVHATRAAVCAFWDFAKNGGAGGWSSAGCSVVTATSWGTTCTCNHLTSFAILLDLSRGGINDPRQAQILTFITYIGCGLSAFFLAATLLTYLSFGKLLRDIPAKILVQLCLSLLLLNLVYLLDGWLARNPARGLCVATAFFLHYFLLTSFTWAGLEALHMYLSIVRVFTPYLSRYMLKFALIGWGRQHKRVRSSPLGRRKDAFQMACLLSPLSAGLPAAVVLAVISADKDNYGLVAYGRDGASGDFCWLRSDAAFYGGVVAYFLLAFVWCLLVLAVVLAQLARIKKQNPHNQSPQRGLAADLRSVAGLVALLGLAWGFALFAWGPLRLPFVYLFTLFNSLQGFFVFVFHCACKENVRRQWRTFLCCGRLRLAENSDWSRTAARHKRNFSVSTSGVSARRLASRSSSLVSSNSASSVFADSGMSEGSSSDVVLNELHRQTAVGF